MRHTRGTKSALGSSGAYARDARLGVCFNEARHTILIFFLNNIV
ncbi:hypothetical protein M6B38_354660 [Iris pallida]|uniref:Uncharacterized protein n=1 Tax=Iris pallida TaxID=29817 RepID=A0AAX6GP29_IRIPA|nr:hypothetical protein M6B38_354660 [Iris pallida]